MLNIDLGFNVDKQNRLVISNGGKTKTYSYKDSKRFKDWLNNNLKERYYINEQKWVIGGIKYYEVVDRCDPDPVVLAKFFPSEYAGDEYNPKELAEKMCKELNNGEGIL